MHLWRNKPLFKIVIPVISPPSDQQKASHLKAGRFLSERNPLKLPFRVYLNTAPTSGWRTPIC